MGSKHASDALAPVEPLKIKLGAKKYELRYTFASMRVVEQRHTTGKGFVRDLLAAFKGEHGEYSILTTILLAGLAHERVTEEMLDALVGSDLDAIQAAGWAGLRPMNRDLGLGLTFGDETDEDGESTSGEEEAGETPAE